MVDGMGPVSWGASGLTGETAEDLSSSWFCLALAHVLWGVEVVRLRIRCISMTPRGIVQVGGELKGSGRRQGLRGCWRLAAFVVRFGDGEWA